MDFIFRKVKMGISEVKLEISWNAAPKNPIQKLFYQQSKGVIIIFDITKKRSFDSISTWIENINNNASASVVKFLIGNKLDLAEERAVSVSDALALAEVLNMNYYETSIKMKAKVEEILIGIVRKIQEESFTSDKVTIILKSDHKGKKKKCCN